MGYKYLTSEKSFLDIRHDSLWLDTVKWLSKSHPNITPNQVTLMGSIPVILISMIHIQEILGSMSFLLLGISLVWYLNMDAIDGKLARFTNRSTPLGQILDHGLDTLIGGLLTVMLFSFFGFTNPIFLSIAVFLGLSIFFQASFKEHISHEMLSSMKFYFGRTEDTAVIMSTTELLYVLSALFFFGFFTVLDDMLFCIPAALAMFGGMIYLNLRMLVQNLDIIDQNARNNMHNSNSDSTSSSSVSSISSIDSGNFVDKSKKSTIKKRNVKTIRRDVFDSNMRPTGDYAGFEMFPQPELENSDSEEAQELNMFDQTSITIKTFYEILNKLTPTQYFTFVTTYFLSLITYFLTLGSSIQLIMMIIYATSVTTDLIFLNTLKLDTTDKNSVIIIKRFTNQYPIIFAAIKILILVISLFAVLFGFLSTASISTMLVLVDLSYIIFYFSDAVGKIDIINSYFSMKKN